VLAHRVHRKEVQLWVGRDPHAASASVSNSNSSSNNDTGAGSEDQPAEERDEQADSEALLIKSAEEIRCCITGWMLLAELCELQESAAIACKRACGVLLA